MLLLSMNTAYTKLALGFVFILTLMFSAGAENLYFKLDLLNTQLNTNVAFQQNRNHLTNIPSQAKDNSDDGYHAKGNDSVLLKSYTNVIPPLNLQPEVQGPYISVAAPFVASDAKNLERQSTRNIGHFTIGYQLSEYLDIEIDVNNYRHKFNRPEVRFGTIQNTITITSTTKSKITSNLFAFAYYDERPYCNKNPNTFLNREEICAIPSESGVRHNLFAFAYNEGGAYCSSIPDTFVNKEEICGTQEVTSLLSSFSSGISSTKVFSKIDILLPRARVKFINNP